MRNKEERITWSDMFARGPLNFRLKWHHLGKVWFEDCYISSVTSTVLLSNKTFNTLVSEFSNVKVAKCSLNRNLDKASRNA